MYTNAKEEKNLDVLLKYAMHRLYGTRCERSAYVVEKDCVFVPAGWDTSRKVAIMFENMSQFRPDTPFDEAFARQRLARAALNRPASSASLVATAAIDVVVEDEQVFLTRMQSLLAKAADGGAQAPSALGPAPAPQPAASNAASVAQAAAADLSAAQLTASPTGRSVPASRPVCSHLVSPPVSHKLSTCFCTVSLTVCSLRRALTLLKLIP